MGVAGDGVRSRAGIRPVGRGSPTSTSASSARCSRRRAPPVVNQVQFSRRSIGRASSKRASGTRSRWRRTARSERTPPPDAIRHDRGSAWPRPGAGAVALVYPAGVPVIRKSTHRERIEENAISSTSRCPTRRWPSSTPSTAPVAHSGPSSAGGGEATRARGRRSRLPVSNPAPATAKGARKGAFGLLTGNPVAIHTSRAETTSARTMAFAGRSSTADPIDSSCALSEAPPRTAGRRVRRRSRRLCARPRGTGGAARRNRRRWANVSSPVSPALRSTRSCN